MAGKPKFTDTQIIAALKEDLGMIFLAAKRLGCDPSTIHRRVNKSVAVKAAVESHRGELIDVAEVALMAAVQAKQPWAIAFTLRTIGKGRGYVEKQEISIVPPEQIDAAIDSELARLARPGKDEDAGTIDSQAHRASS
jgi:hypothetical protein